MILKNGTRVVAARNRYGSPVEVVDEGYGSGDTVYLYGDETGTRLVVVAQSWEDAYEAAIDSRPTIPKDEVYEAYGFDSPEEMAAWEGEYAREGEYRELEEGYQYQSNASGTGIVNAGHYEWSRAYEPRTDPEHVRLIIRDLGSLEPLQTRLSYEKGGWLVNVEGEMGPIPVRTYSETIELYKRLDAENKEGGVAVEHFYPSDDDVRASDPVKLQKAQLLAKAGFSNVMVRHMGGDYLAYPSDQEKQVARDYLEGKGIR